jgi:hypothetical protein
MGVTVNFLAEQTCKVSSEMLLTFIQHYTGTPYGMVAHDVTRHFMSLSDACPTPSQICKLVLFSLVTPD